MTTEASTRDPFAELDDRLEEDPPRSWRPGWKAPKDDARAAFPVDAEIIRGTFIREEVGSTQEYGDKLVIILAEHPTGELRSVWCLHQNLAEDWSRQRAQPGALVAIRYDGLTQPKKGKNPYHAYRVVVKNPATPAGPASSPVPDAADAGDEAPY